MKKPRSLLCFLGFIVLSGKEIHILRSIHSSSNDLYGILKKMKTILSRFPLGRILIIFIMVLGLVTLTIYVKNRTYKYSKVEMVYVAYCLRFLQAAYYGSNLFDYLELAKEFGRDCSRLPYMPGVDGWPYRSHIDYKKGYYIVYFKFNDNRSLVFNSLTDDYSKYAMNTILEKYNGFYRVNLEPVRNSCLKWNEKRTCTV